MTEEYRLITTEIAALQKQLDAAKDSAKGAIVNDLNDAIKRRRREVLDRFSHEILAEAQALRRALDPVFESQQRLQRLGLLFQETFVEMYTHDGRPVLANDAQKSGPLLIVCRAFSGIFTEPTIGAFAKSLDSIERSAL